MLQALPAHAAGSASPYLSPEDRAQVIDDQRVVGSLAARDSMETRRNKCNLYTQDLLAQELDSYIPVPGQVANKMLAKVNTPLRMTEWERAMASHPDWEFVEREIREGFRIGYNHRGHTCRPASKTMHLARQNRQVVEEYPPKEVKEGEYPYI